MTNIVTLKSAVITSLDAAPGVRTSNWAGGGQQLQTVNASISSDGTDTTGSVLRLVRIPSVAKLYNVKLWLDAANTTCAGDVTLYYSDNAIDFPNGKTGLVTAHVFKTTLDIHAVVSPTEYLLGGNILGAGLNKRAFDMAALSADPGGSFDIVFKTTSDSSGAYVLNAQVHFGVD